ncbi:hypothetical protein [Sulfurirhabdus autotrophica]|nr:hypothetical protein [Sulfurirhabdus autotrophica]
MDSSNWFWRYSIPEPFNLPQRHTESQYLVAVNCKVLRTLTCKHPQHIVNAAQWVNWPKLIDNQERQFTVAIGSDVKIAAKANGEWLFWILDSWCG